MSSAAQQPLGSRGEQTLPSGHELEMTVEIAFRWPTSVICVMLNPYILAIALVKGLRQQTVKNKFLAFTFQRFKLQYGQKYLDIQETQDFSATGGSQWSSSCLECVRLWD